MKSKEIQVDLEKVYKLFNQGEYKSTFDGLSKIESKHSKNITQDAELEGLISYWKGITSSKMNNYALAIQSFERAIQLKYNSKDLFYEYGQALYVSEKLIPARIAFRKSVKLKYKIAVSIYYIGFISQQLKDYKKAVSFYNTIEQLSDEEKKEVIQASRMQIADIYYLQVRKRPNSYEAIKKYVIPQYEKALDWDEESSLAIEIKAKIENIKRKFDMELFQMRNGRNTARPPYFLKINAMYGSDDNVNLVDNDTRETTSDEISASYSTLALFGRYTYYPNSSFSIAPEIRATTTRYMSDNSEIFANDNSKFNFNLKMNYEKLYNKAPATTYIDLIYGLADDDSDEDKTLERSFTEKGISISEERQFWKGNPSIFRLKYMLSDYEDSVSSFTTSSLIWEQVMNFSKLTLYLYSAYDSSRFSEQFESDTDTFTIRTDFIFPTFLNLFNPIFYLSGNSNRYVNDSDRGTTSLKTLGISLNRPISKSWYLTFDYSDSFQTGDDEGDEYTKKVMTLNLDYVY